MELPIVPIAIVAVIVGIGIWEVTRRVRPASRQISDEDVRQGRAEIDARHVPPPPSRH